MNCISILKDITTLLQMQCSFPVMTDFPQTLTGKNKKYAVIGIRSLYTEKPINSSGNAPCKIKVNFSLFDAPEADIHNMISETEENIFPVFMSSNINTSDASIIFAGFNSKLRLKEVSAVFTVCGIFSSYNKGDVKDD